MKNFKRLIDFLIGIGIGIIILGIVAIIINIYSSKNSKTYQAIPYTKSINDENYTNK
jgi:hypothetical protein